MMKNIEEQLDNNSFISINSLKFKFQNFIKKEWLRNSMRMVLILIGYAMVMLVNVYLSEAVSNKIDLKKSN